MRRTSFKSPTYVGRPNPVARAVRTLGIRGLVTARTKQEKRAKDKLRQLLRSYDHIAGSIQLGNSS